MSSSVRQSGRESFPQVEFRVDVFSFGVIKSLSPPPSLSRARGATGECAWEVWFGDSRVGFGGVSVFRSVGFPSPPLESG